MNHSQIKSFYEDVLGLRSVYLDLQPTPGRSIYVENFKSYTTPEIELFDKVLQSIGLDRVSIEVISDLNTPSKCELYFLDSPSNEPNQVSSPRAMLANPSLKKSAWEKLKKINS